MWHSKKKIVPHFAVVFKDRSHVLPFTTSMNIFSPLQGSEGLNCPTSLEHPFSIVSAPQGWCNWLVPKKKVTINVDLYTTNTEALTRYWKDVVVQNTQDSCRCEGLHRVFGCLGLDVWCHSVG